MRSAQANPAVSPTQSELDTKTGERVQPAANAHANPKKHFVTQGTAYNPAYNKQQMAMQQQQQQMAMQQQQMTMQQQPMTMQQQHAMQRQQRRMALQQQQLAQMTP